MATEETCKLQMDKEVSCNPHKYFELFKHTLHHLVEIFPESYKKCEILQGDGKSVGSVRRWTYILPGTTEVLVSKETTEVIDDENMKIVLDEYEGDHTNDYNKFVITIQVIPKAVGAGGVVKWSLEFDKCHDAAVDPHHYMELFGMIHDKVDAHLVATAKAEAEA